MANDKDAKDLMSSLMSPMVEMQKQLIEKATADDIFKKLQIEARVPNIEKKKKSEDLDNEIEEFVSLATK